MFFVVVLPQPIPIVFPESPRQSPTSSVEPIDLRDIGDLPVKLELRYAIESRRTEKGLDMPATFQGRKRERPQVKLLFYIPSTNKGTFCNNSKTDALISKQLSVENKAKLSQLTRAHFVTIAKLIH